MYELRYSGAAQKYFKKIKENGLQKAFENALTSIAESRSSFYGILSLSGK